MTYLSNVSRMKENVALAFARSFDRCCFKRQQPAQSEFLVVTKNDSRAEVQPAAEQGGRARFWTGNVPGSESSSTSKAQWPDVSLFRLSDNKALRSPAESVQTKFRR